MKLWKRTVLLMLVTLLCALIPVGTLSLYITGKRSLNNAAETYGRQLENGKILLEQFWDNSKYEQMSETGKQAYMGFQFRRCCGEGMALIDRKSNAVIENLTDYKVVGLENLGLKDEGDPYAYKIQKLGQKYLLLQMESLSRPEGYEVLSVREVTGLFAELRQTAVCFLGIYLAVFLIAGLFIYMMMRRTVEQMEKLQEVAEKQELLMGALSHEMRTPLTSDTDIFHNCIIEKNNILKNNRKIFHQCDRINFCDICTTKCNFPTIHVIEFSCQFCGYLPCQGSGCE